MRDSRDGCESNEALLMTLVSLVQFLFIVAVPLVAVGGGLVTLFLVGFVFDTL